MDDLGILRVLTVLLLLAFHTVMLLNCCKILQVRRMRWAFLLAPLNTAAYVATVWLSLDMFIGFLLLLALYMSEHFLLFGKGFTDTIFTTGLMPFLLLCIQGIVIPFLTWEYGITMHTLIDGQYYYNLSLIFSLVLFGFLTLAMNRFFPAERIRLLLSSPGQKRLACTSLYIFYFYLILETYVYYLDFPHVWMLTFHLVTSLVILLGFLVVLWYAIDISAYIEYELKTRQVEKQLQRQVAHYQQYTKYINALRAFKHDYKHMVDIVRRMVEQGEREKALELLGQMNREMEGGLQYQPYSNDVMVDALLQECAGRCADQKVAFSATVEIPKGIGISDLDLCRIFGNLTDNAYEACCQMQPQQHPFIRIQSRQSGGWLTVEVQNAYVGEVQLDQSGWPITQKRDRMEHGLGLRSICEIIERQGGFLQLEVDKERKIFTAKVHFCMP